MKEKTYYKITFTNETAQEEEMFQVSARHVAASDLYGLVEISGFIFPDGKLLYSPAEERLKKEFEGIKRTWLPYHAIIRIDEVSETTHSELKVVGIDTARRKDKKEKELDDKKPMKTP